MKLKLFLLLTGYILAHTIALGQELRTDTLIAPPIPPRLDSSLRIVNMSPFITLHVDSTMNYQLAVNRNSGKYFWYLRNAPVGLKINKDNGNLTFKAEKSFFLSGKLLYDKEYKVKLGVENFNDPKERVDTVFSITFYNTDIVLSKIKPSVSSPLIVEEGDTVNFKVQCENGNFPIEQITFFANIPLKNYTLVKQCDDDFTWSPPFDFVKESDSAKVKVLLLSFVGVNKFHVSDTATVKIIVRDALNYPLAMLDHKMITKNIRTYILQLKYSFLQLDKRVKNSKTSRTTFDITSSTTALTGSILSSSANNSTQKFGQVLPSIGISLVPIKEAVSPQRTLEQNQAALVRSSIKRLEYMISDNALISEKDPDIAKKINKLKDELKQIQIQLIDLPIEMSNSMTEDELNKYFNSPKVQKKYRLKK